MNLSLFPNTRYMGSKRKLLPSLDNVLSQLKFDSALDAFSGSSSVSYLLKTLGKSVNSNDYLLFNYHIARATIENQKYTLSKKEEEKICKITEEAGSFIEKTFSNIYFSRKDCRWLDSAIYNINFLKNKYKKSIALAALCRACIKKRPRGIFTYTGTRYDDGRKDIRITLQDQFKNAISVFNNCVFDNHNKCRAYNKDIFRLESAVPHLVYLDPPYFSMNSDSEYSCRYHFVEGLVSYWSHVDIDYSTKTKKIKRPFSKFNHKNMITGAFEELFEKYKKSIIVLSYSSNGFPSSDNMISLLKNQGKSVEFTEIDYTYSVGTHSHKKNNKNNKVKEYLFLAL